RNTTSPSLYTNLTKSSSDIILCLLKFRPGKDALGFGIFYNLPQVKECGALGNPGCLLHGMGNNHNGKFPPEFVNQLLNLSSSNRVKRRTWLIHQDHLRAYCNSAGNTQTLLL